MDTIFQDHRQYNRINVTSLYLSDDRVFLWDYILFDWLHHSCAHAIAGRNDVGCAGFGFIFTHQTIGKFCRRYELCHFPNVLFVLRPLPTLENGRKL